MITIKNRSGDVIHNLSYTHLVAISISNMESRSYTFRCLNQSDCNSMEELGKYANSYYSRMTLLRGAKLIADNSSSQVNSIEIDIAGNASVYNGRGVIYDFTPEVEAGRKIYDRTYTFSLYWLGDSWGTEIKTGLYRKDL